MEFEWIAPQKTRHNAGHTLFSQSSSPPQTLLQASISASLTTAATAPAPAPSVSVNTDTKDLPLIPSVPVPIITVGKVFAPIPQGHRTLHPEAMEAARHLGIAPMLAAAMGTGMWSSPDEFWDIASLTDPLTASNLMQVSPFEQRRLLFVERGAAERLARGKGELVHLEKKQREKKNGEQNRLLGFLKALNPMVAFEGVCDALARGISKATAMDSLILLQQQEQEQQHGSSGNQTTTQSNAPVVFNEEETFQMNTTKEEGKSSQNKEESKEKNGNNTTTATATASPFFDVPFPSSAAPFGNAAAKEEQGLFGTSSTNKTSSSTGMPALAHIPLRLALSLLRGASGRFLLLSGKADDPKKKKKNRGGGGGGENNDEQLVNSEEQPALYGGADSLDTLQVYFLPKFDFSISTTLGDVKFYPGFLSESALAKFYKREVDGIVKRILAKRQVRRKAYMEKLRLVAAIVAGAGSGGGAGGSGRGFGDDDDEEEEGFGDSPDIYEAIQEISEELPGGLPGITPTLGPSSSSIVRAGATLATGIFTLIAPLVLSIGGFKDRATTLSWKLMDEYPYKLHIASRPLGPLLKTLASYNATQAHALATSTSLHNSTTAGSPAASIDAATALALTGLCMAVGTKLTGDALTSNPSRFLHAIGISQDVPGTGTGEESGIASTRFSTFGVSAGSGWAAAAATAAAAVAQSNGESKETELTAILRSVLPSLEFNGFAEALPMAGKDEESKLAAVAEMVREVLLKEHGHLEMDADFDLEAGPEKFLDDMNTASSLASSSSTPAEKPGEKVEGEGEGEKEKVRPTLGRGLVLIGDPGRVLGLSTRRGFSLDGVGIPVGVDDGRRYL